MTAKIRPLGNRVLVRRSKVKTTEGGIYLPDSAQEKPKEGEVLAVGPGKRDEQGQLIPMDVKVGNRVVFTSYAGTEVKSEQQAEEELLILREDEILGILA